MESLRQPDTYSQVGRLAQRLGIGEFVLFERAYEHWYEHCPSRELLERTFGYYLRAGAIPAWVRSYIRQCGPDEAPGTRLTTANRIAEGTLIAWLALCFALFTGLL